MPAATNPTPPVALTIAGSDSGGGAGVQADLKTFHQFGVFGTSAITAVTAQNTTGVSAVHMVPPDMLQAQVRSVVEDLPPAAVKTGMLGTAAHARVVGEFAADGSLPNLVIDPVMVATSGDRLLDAGAERAIADLLPHATLVTPNRLEAEILTGLRIRDEADMEAAGRLLVQMGAGAALMKAGHSLDPEGDTLTDILFDGHGVHRFPHVRHDTTSTHGTGCTLSAALAACLGRGDDLHRATGRAIDFVTRAIGGAAGLGAGRGPVDHFAPVGE